MNAKKAKAIRRMMRNAKEIGQMGEDVTEREYKEIENRAKYMLDKDEEGKTTKVKIAHGQIVNKPNTIRAIYRKFKTEIEKIEDSRK